MKKQTDWIALLTLEAIPTKKRERTRLINWLKKITKEIETEDPKIFATPCRVRLMK